MESIRQKYLPKEDNKMERLRRLDERVPGIYPDHPKERERIAPEILRLSEELL